MPETIRALRMDGETYALVITGSLTDRNDYVFEVTGDKAKASNRTTTVYLCSPDGLFTEVYSVTKEPPKSGTGWLKGERASAEEIWDAISDLFS
ncbi:MAG: hypothetical protein IJT43_09195 [Stomatobaculum sp.]|nr:hypothetical protein [Stomatobaculum sp.]